MTKQTLVRKKYILDPKGRGKSRIGELQLKIAETMTKPHTITEERAKTARFTCKICGTWSYLDEKYYRFCREHGRDGSEHGIFDSIMRAMGKRKYKFQRIK